MIQVIQIGDYTIRVFPSGSIQIDNPITQQCVTKTPGFFIDAVKMLEFNNSVEVVKVSKSNNRFLNGKKIRVLGRDIQQGDFVMAATGSKKGYGWLRYVTKLHKKGDVPGCFAQTFQDDGKVSSQKPLELCYCKNYMVVEFLEDIEL